MARYRLLEKTFINNALWDAGAIIEYDGQPGSTLQPLDVKAKGDIPEGWHNQTGAQRIALARSLGARKERMSVGEADAWISNEIENREASKDAKVSDKADEPEPDDNTKPAARQTAAAKHK